MNKRPSPPPASPVRVRTRRKGDYAVGYGKPPVASRFKPGQSGNPRGRPKGASTVLDKILGQLNARIEVTIGGRKQKLTLAEASVRNLLHLSLQGDANALRQVVRLLPVLMQYQAHAHPAPCNEAAARTAEAESIDQALIDETLRTLGLDWEEDA